MNTVARSCFSPYSFDMLPTPPFLDKRLGKQNIVYQDLSKEIYELWLHTLQKRQKTFDDVEMSSVHTSYSIFDYEDRLLNLLFNFSVNPHKKTVFEFCCLLKKNAQQKSSINDITLLQTAIEQIGQIIFLAEQNIRLTASLLNINDIPGSLKQVQCKVEENFNACLLAIEKRRLQHDKVPLQDSSKVVKVQKSLAIAKMMMTSSGQLNVGLIKSIRKYFFNTEVLLKFPEKNFLNTLEDIVHSNEIQELLLTVTKPFSPYFVSNALIRIALDLDPNNTPSDQQARTVALAALLSDIQQDNTGYSLASYIFPPMIGALKCKLLEDLGNILVEGKLLRPGNKECKSFMPSLDIGDEVSINKISIDSEAKMQAGMGYLWESPGIIAACRQLGIEDIKTDVKKIITNHYLQQKVNLSELVEISPQEIIYKLVEGLPELRSLSPQEIRDLQNIALFAFSSETSSPLLKAWESCLEGMAEINDKGGMRQRILNCVLSSLSNQLPKTFCLALTKEAKKIQNIFQRTLERGIQLRYDDQIIFKPLGKDNIKISGAYVLYELSSGEFSTSAKRIKAPEDFENFIKTRLKVTSEIFHTISNLPNQCNYQKIIQKIQSCVSKNNSSYSSFLKKVIRSYHEDNRYLLDPLNTWESLSHLPFCDFAEDGIFDPQSSMNGFIATQSEIIRPKNALELLETFIICGREKLGKGEILNEEESIQPPFKGNTQYTFNLTFDDPSIVEAIQTNQAVPYWIEKKLLETGNRVANLNLSIDQKNQFIECVAKSLVPMELSSTFINQMQNLDSDKNTVHFFCNQILQSILNLDPNNKNNLSEISANLTGLLFNTVLAKADNAQIIQSAVRIAETSLGENQDFHFCFACFFDPITNALQLGLIKEDKGEEYLLPLNQKEWVFNIPWDIFGLKTTSILTNQNIDLLSV